MKASGTVKDIYPSVPFNCPTPLKNYPGNKKVEGLYHQIISLIPPHKLFIEFFAGSATIFRYKKQSDISSLIDLDPAVIQAWVNEKPNACKLHLTVASGIDEIKKLQNNNALTFGYCDPPYIISCRSSQKQLYNREMTIEQHEEFLSVVRKVGFNCMISHYPHKMYDSYLKKWNFRDFTVSVRGRIQIERVYFNYKAPTVLHDYRYLGSDAWHRQGIRRKLHRLILKLEELPVIEKNAIIDFVLSNRSAKV